MEALASALDPVVRIALEALLNGLWQGAALAATVGLLLRMLSWTSAATRYVVWWATLCAVALLPLVSGPLRVLAAPKSGFAGRALGAFTGGVAAIHPATSWSGISWAPASPLPLVLLVALAIVAAAHLARLAIGLRALRRWKRECWALPAEAAAVLRPTLDRYAVRGVQVRQSATVTTPITVGFRRPVVLLPSRLLCQLSDAELMQVTLHELAHVRRRDDWSNLGQRLLEGIFWFNPAIRWIGARLEVERELACDAEVVAAHPARRSYALCLTRLAQLASSARSTLAPGAVPPQAQLARRIRALVTPDHSPSSSVSLPAVAVVLALLVCCTAALGSTTAVRLLPLADLPLATLAAVRALPVPAANPAATSIRSRAAGTGHRPAASASPAAGAWEAAWDRSAEGVPEPRLALACGASACDQRRTAPAIVEQARVVAPTERGHVGQTASSRPMTRERSGAVVEVTLAVVTPAAPGNDLPWQGAMGGMLNPGRPVVPGGLQRPLRIGRTGLANPWRFPVPFPARW